MNYFIINYIIAYNIIIFLNILNIIAYYIKFEIIKN